MSQIESSLSTSTLRFNNSPAVFEITVKNLSRDYAAFKVALTAAGEPDSERSWYSLDPITSTLIPPGDVTQFCVTILSPPILGVDLINLEVKISSLELPDIHQHSLKLWVDSAVKQLKVELPVRYFAIYPRKVIEIPVRIRNLDRQRVDALLKLNNLDPRWLEKGAERRLSLEAGKEQEISFTCQTPIVKETVCGVYPFTVRAMVGGAEWGQTSGEVEILPLGTVFFTASPEHNVLRRKNPWQSRSPVPSLTYQLQLKNASNVKQEQIAFAVEGKQDSHRLIPAKVAVKPGASGLLKLEVSKKLPWWGLKRIYPLKIMPTLSDSRLNTTDPSSQTITMTVEPLLPPWLQLGLGAIATATILWLWSLLSAGHSARVNSVTFSNNINPIFSASTDGSLRQWKGTPDNLLCRWFNWQNFCLQHQNVLMESQGNSVDGINTVKLGSKKDSSGTIAFLGFDSGKAMEIDLQSQQKTEIIGDRDSDAPTKEFNRILDLTFTPDLKKIYWGRGTRLLEWNVDDKTQQDLITRDNSIYVLTLTADYQTIIAGGLANKIFRILLNQPDSAEELELHPLLNKDSDRITGLEITDSQILITADNRGLIQFWDFNRCQDGKCPLLYRQQQDSEISALAIAKNRDRYYLAIGDGDGTISLWSFANDSKQIELKSVGEIARYPQKIRSIDLIYQQRKSEGRFLILSGSEDRQVRLNVFNLTWRSK